MMKRERVEALLAEAVEAPFSCSVGLVVSLDTLSAPGMAEIKAASSGSAFVARFGGATSSSRATADVGRGELRGRGSELVQGFTAVAVRERIDRAQRRKGGERRRKDAAEAPGEGGEWEWGKRRRRRQRRRRRRTRDCS